MSNKNGRPSSIFPSGSRDRKAALGADRYLRDESIQILKGREWYLSGDDLDLEKVIQGWNDKLDVALARGYSGLRFSADTAWLEKKDWKEFNEYEDGVWTNAYVRFMNLMMTE